VPPRTQGGGAVQASFVEAVMVRPLRHAVLRAGRPVETTVLTGDDDPLSRHVALRRGTETLAVGSIMPEAPPWSPDAIGCWRLRGMATREDARRHGYGSTVLKELLSYASGRQGRLVWCAARVPAMAFYERFGFAARGNRFVSNGVEHVHMYRHLLGAPSTVAP